MTEVHNLVGALVIAVNIFAAAVGFIFFIRRREPFRLYLHLVVLGQVAVIGQAVLGLLLLAGDYRAVEKMHYVYGGIALAAIISPWMYAPRDTRKRLLWFIGASVVAAGIGARAYVTGS